MGIYFRKSRSSGPFRFTVTKRGFSSSVGGGPFRLTANSKGRVRSTARIPGSGIYASSSFGPKRRRGQASHGQASQRQSSRRGLVSGHPVIAVALCVVALWFLTHNWFVVLGLLVLLIGGSAILTAFAKKTISEQPSLNQPTEAAAREGDTSYPTAQPQAVGGTAETGGAWSVFQRAFKRGMQEELDGREQPSTPPR